VVSLNLLSTPVPLPLSTPELNGRKEETHSPLKVVSSVKTRVKLHESE
jgi:hypothetical protein